MQVRRDLLDQILALREDVERELKANKYYIALHKIDEMLAALQPLDIAESMPAPAAEAQVEAQPEPQVEAQPQPEAPAESPDERTWSGVVQQTVSDPGWRRPAASDEVRPD
jgi:hypothetical protein